jgi:uncharacterized protein involved in cysteine biosynthesis
MILVLRAWFDAWKLIFRRNLFHWLILSGVVAILIHMGILGFSFYVAFKIWSALTPQSAQIEFSLSSILHTIAQSVTALASGCIVWWLAFRMHKVIYLTAISPILSSMMSNLSSSSGIELRKKPLWLHSVLRGILLAWRNFVLELLIGASLWGLTWLIGSLLPLLLWIIIPASSVISIVLSSYFYGISLFDFTLESRGMNYRESLQEYKKLRSPSVYLGLLFVAISWIPFIGLTIAPVTCSLAGKSLIDK